MPFFARPNLDDTQFKQLPDSCLSLSGQTRILTVSGLTLTDGAGSNIVVTAENASSHVGDVLTYDGAGKIRLLPAGGASDVVYMGGSPTTCTVGGLTCGTCIYGTGVTKILEMILYPTLYPALTPPDNTLSIVPSTTLYEVGTSINITACQTFNRGCINPQYTSASNKRSGLPVSYNYIAWGGSCPVQPSGGLCTNSYALAAYSVAAGNNIVSGAVSYAAGVQPKDSEDNNYCSPLPAGVTGSKSVTITGLYPYFYGKVTCACPAGVGRPSLSTICSCIIAGCGKTVACSMSNITVTFGSGACDYIWFATPNASTTKTCWYVDATNKGAIGGGVSAGCNLFPAFDSASITTVCWAGQTYKVYISNYQTASALPMELRNS